MPPAEFEPADSANARPQNHALDGAATGIGQGDDKARNLFSGF